MLYYMNNTYKLLKSNNIPIGAQVYYWMNYERLIHESLFRELMEKVEMFNKITREKRND